VQRGQHRQELVTLRRGQGLAPPARLPAQEREHRDGMPAAERAHRLAVPRRDRGHDELERGVAAERDRGRHGRAQAREDVRPGPAEPALVVQVVHGDEPLVPLVAGDRPVVAAVADRGVPQRPGG